MHRNKPDITDLLSDESFINYCKNTSPEDTAYWENYIRHNPLQKELIEMAREKFLFLFNALAEADREEQADRLKSRLNQEAPVVKMEERIEIGSRKKYGRWLKIAGAATVLTVIAYLAITYAGHSNKDNTLKTFATTYGERKNIQLPDGSVVNLNAGSTIRIDESFDVSERNVYLEGEAYFDVKHNEKKAFIVHTAEMDIKALGTAFDVKAYKEERITEASLIRGLVEVTLKKNNNKALVLHPNQKITWKNDEPEVRNNTVLTATNKLSKHNEGMPEKLRVSVQGDIKEIAWKDNKLIFEDDELSDIAHLLERWYGVHIEFGDDSIRSYRFTAIFEKEDLQTVLNFLKESKPFNYKINNGETLTVYLSR